MELVFNQINDRWEAEIKVTADFNLHIEGVREGNVSVFMRGTESGEYAYVRGATPYPSVGTVYEYDFSAVIFPKYIKVACASQPSLAVVTSAGEVIQIEKPVEPDVPSEPEVIEYHFEIPMAESGLYGDIFGYTGRVDGDFSDIYSKLVSLITDYGSDNIPQSVFTEKTNITVNQYKATSMAELYEGEICLTTNAPWYEGGGSDLTITQTYANYEHGL